MKDKGCLFLNPVRNYFMRERNTFRCFDSRVIISVSSIYEPLCDEFWITSVTSEHSSVSTPFWHLHSQHNHSLQVWQDLWSGVSIKKKFGSAPSPKQMWQAFVEMWKCWRAAQQLPTTADMNRLHLHADHYGILLVCVCITRRLEIQRRRVVVT